MPLMDRITESFSRISPSNFSKPSTSMSGGIGHGMVPLDDDMIVSKPAIVFYTSQIFFNFLAMACFASVASFQAHWAVGPSGLSGFALFISVAGMFLSSFMLFVPVVHEKYDKLTRVARALREVRVGFILTSTGVTASLLIAFITTISAWTQPGCKDANSDPHAKSRADGFKNGLPGWCSTKKAGAIFFWLAFVFWSSSFALLILDWRSGKLHTGPLDPPFNPQVIHDAEAGDDEEEEDEPSYTHVPPASTAYTQTTSTLTAAPQQHIYDNPFSDTNRYSSATSASPSYATAPSGAPPAGRPSMEVYGAFSDPAPSGFGAPPPSGYPHPAAPSTTTGSYATPGSAFSSPSRPPASNPPVLPEVDVGPRVSRTMQYADPYAAVRATLASQQQSPTGGLPPYQGYQ